MHYLLAGVIGLFGGVTSGLFGVGGGIVMVPAMILLLKLDPKVAIGTSLVVIIPTALTGSFKHHDLRQIHWAIAFSLIPAAMIGAWFGARLTQVISAADLKRAFGGFLILVGLRLLLWK